MCDIKEEECICKISAHEFFEVNPTSLLAIWSKLFYLWFFFIKKEEILFSFLVYLFVLYFTCKFSLNKQNKQYFSHFFNFCFKERKPLNQSNDTDQLHYFYFEIFSFKQ
ncbi:unnamed protein product [Schistosoma curassoni]|nr:unnamed protein product [Schistosoma curassoni]